MIVLFFDSDTEKLLLQKDITDGDLKGYLGGINMLQYYKFNGKYFRVDKSEYRLDTDDIYIDLKECK